MLAFTAATPPTEPESDRSGAEGDEDQRQGGGGAVVAMGGVNSPPVHGGGPTLVGRFYNVDLDKEFVEAEVVSMTRAGFVFFKLAGYLINALINC